jgi:adenosylcobyric acid synthase
MVMNKAKCLSLLGTGSDVGKSFVVAGICRALKARGYRVAPYKAQNMSNNSYVTLDGLEMGRAQVVQAEACNLEPEVDMNPVLLKPSGESQSQVVLQGRVIGSRHARDYYKQTDGLFIKAMESLERLRDAHDFVVMEGAGSCAEVNLRSRDIVNFRPAHEVDAPVVLIADIDRGGVFAQIVGSLEVISPEDRQRVKGIIINRFRGDRSLFEDGVKWIEQRTAIPVLGVLPFDREIAIDSEDGMAIETVVDPGGPLLQDAVNIAVLLFPRISNHTDLAALQCTPGVTLHFLSRPRSLQAYDQLILPGSKNVRADLDWLRRSGWESRIQDYQKNGGRIGGLCGGYQMMGQKIEDPEGVEGRAGVSEGLGLLPVSTVLSSDKLLQRSRGVWAANGAPVYGYEIHMGRTELPDSDLAAAAIQDLTAGDDFVATRSEGIYLDEGKLWGSYLHGLFDSGAFRLEYLSGLRPDLEFAAKGEDNQLGAAEDFDAYKQRQYDRLGKHIEANINMEQLISLVDLS